MSPDTTHAAARRILTCWTNGTVIDALGDHERPKSRADGYAIQAAMAAEVGSPVVGWKIAATSHAGQSHIGVDGPLAGRIFASRVHRSGATLSLTGNRMRVAEPEFAFRCGHRLGPRATPYTTAEVTESMSELVLALEVPDSRFADFARAGAPQLLADNACAHDLVLGAPAPDGWRRLDLARYPTAGRIGSGPVREGSGGNVLGDPRIALAWFVNEITGLGLTLEPGQIVTTGTSLTPLAIVPGDHVRADFGELGRIEARFA